MRYLKTKLTLLVVVLALCACSFIGCSGDSAGNSSGGTSVNYLQQYYNAVVASQEKLDDYADDIYQCWYDAIYKNKYGSNINTAIAYANTMNRDNIAFLEENDALIASLYKNVKDNANVKEVMAAYSEYYEFVVNVSGSFTTYSQSKEANKKALATALKKLSYEL